MGFTLATAFAVLAVIVALPSLRTVAAADTQVSAAAEGVFPSGATYAGVSLQGSTFGIGIVIRSSGSAVGEFQTVLSGTGLLGSARTIALDGAVTAGALNTDGSATFSGTGRLDLGDGSLPTNVPFTATVTAAGLQLTIGATALPTQGLGAGAIDIQ
jgi:hypothetical protein